MRRVGRGTPKRERASACVGALCAAWLLGGAVPAHAAPGQLDGHFGHRGIVRKAIHGGLDNVDDSVAVDGHGRIVVLATGANRHSTLLRFKPSGALDRSFGDNGSAAVPGGPWHDLALDPEGRIVLAGSANREATLARYDQGGDLDPSFGPSGEMVTVRVEPGGYDREWRVAASLVAVAIQAEGKIVAAGNVRYCPPEEEGEECYSGSGFVARTGSSGALDPGFGDNGIAMPVSPVTGGGVDRIRSLSLAPDAKIVVGGSRKSALAVARLSTDGSLDDSFSKDGVATTAKDAIFDVEAGSVGEARALAVQPDGRIVAVGKRILWGLTADGEPDPDFGSEGEVPNAGGGLYRDQIWAEDALVDPRHRILVAGQEGHRTVISRYFPNGRRDARFAGDGVAYVNASRGADTREHPTGLALTPGGSILTAGPAFVDKHRKLTLIRLRGHGDGRLARCHGKLAALQGTPGPDRLVGWGPVVAFGGDDEIISQGGPVCAGAGDDAINRGESFGQRESAGVFAGPGDDRIVAAGHGPVYGGPGNDVIRAERGDEVGNYFFGGPGADLLSGGKGPDRLHGGPGADTLIGGNGNDDLAGGPGEDVLLQGQISPPPTVYRMRRPGFRVRLTVRGRRITGIHITVHLHCVKGGGTRVSTVEDNRAALKIDADGRFRHASSGIDRGEYLAGRVRPRTIVGAFSELGEYDRDRCLTGRRGHRVLRFTARRIRAHAGRTRQRATARPH